MDTRPIIGISMGDPYGNGPEITVKALNNKELYQRCRPLVVGDFASMDYATKVMHKLYGIDLKINVITSEEQAKFTYGTIDLISMDIIQNSDLKGDINDIKPFKVGPSELGGEASFRYVEKLIRLALKKQVDATVTNAISKEAINMAGHHYSGHTEIFAYYTNTTKYTMMLAHENLRVVHNSTHVSLKEAIERVKKERVLEVIRIANQGCKDLGINEPRIAVAGLNPHCGENGMFGREEIEEIQPAIDQALNEGINIVDKKPIAPDTVFSKARGGFFDIVVTMYHDQGHIPLKTVGFVYNQNEHKWDAVAGVNITLGLPIIRTSVDHGTGWDIAGDGSANCLSLTNAIDYAIKMALAKRGE